MATKEKVKKTFEKSYEQVLVKDLRLGDKITLDLEYYGTATVFQKRDGVVHMIRPYIHTSDFSYTGGVCWYIGQETIKVSELDTRPFSLISRGGPLK